MVHDFLKIFKSIINQEMAMSESTYPLFNKFVDFKQKPNNTGVSVPISVVFEPRNFYF